MDYFYCEMMERLKIFLESWKNVPLYDVVVCATIGGHSYLLIMITCMNDPVHHLTDSEFAKKPK